MPYFSLVVTHKCRRVQLIKSYNSWRLSLLGGLIGRHYYLYEVVFEPGGPIASGYGYCQSREVHLAMFVIPVEMGILVVVSSFL